MGLLFEEKERTWKASLVLSAEKAPLKEEHMRKNLHSVFFKRIKTEYLSTELTGIRDDFLGNLT